MKIKRILILSLFFMISGLLIYPLNAEFVVVVEPEDEVTVVFDNDIPAPPPVEEPPAEEPTVEEPAEVPGTDTVDLTVDDTNSNIVYKKLVFNLSDYISENTTIIEGRIWFSRSKNDTDKYYEQARLWIKQLPKKNKESMKVSLKKKWSKPYTSNCKKGGYEWNVTDELIGLITDGNDSFEINVKYYNKESLSKSFLLITYENEESSETGALISASVDVYPKTINLKSRRSWIKAHIELPEEYDANEIDISSVKITEIDGSQIEAISIANGYKKASGLMVRFPREELKKVLSPAVNVSITVAGSLASGEKFVGKTLVNVIEPGINKLISVSGGGVGNLKNANINIPLGALDEATEITIATDEETEEEDSDEDQDSDNALDEQELEGIGKGCHFGPEGTQFNKPVLITLYYDDIEGNDSRNLNIYYWNTALRLWEVLANSEVDTANNSVSAEVKHFSLYRVLSTKAAESNEDYLGSSFRLGEVYCYPSPAREGIDPTFHVEADNANEIQIRIFNVAGNEVNAILLDGSNIVYKNSIPAYEYVWNTAGVASGVYVYSVTAVKEGHQSLRVIKKMGIVK